jgi:hypothetical protein
MSANSSMARLSPAADALNQDFVGVTLMAAIGSHCGGARSGPNGRLMYVMPQFTPRERALGKKFKI